MSVGNGSPTTGRKAVLHSAGFWTASMAIAGFVVAAITLGIYYFVEQRLNSARRLDEQKQLFQHSIQDAEKTYCASEGTGVPTQVKMFIDQAVQLEPNINTELRPLHYVALASVGSSVLALDKAFELGKEGLRRAEASNDPIEKYAANIVLGHIDFMRFRDRKDQAYLVSARDYFGKAKDTVDDDSSLRNIHFLGQAYLIWGTNEMFVGQNDEAKKIIDQARRAWNDLPQPEIRKGEIDHAVAEVERGLSPRLPCPSFLTVSPATMPKLSRSGLSESSMVVPNNNQSVYGTPSPTPATDAQNGKELTDLREQVQGLSNNMSKQLGELRSLIVRNEKKVNSPDTSAAPKLDKPRNGVSDEPKTPKIPDPNTFAPNVCGVVLHNTTAFTIRPIINGFEDEKWEIGPRDSRHFTVPCGELRLERRDVSSAFKAWSPSIFLSSNGTKMTPVIHITNCCYEFRDEYR